MSDTPVPLAVRVLNVQAKVEALTRETATVTGNASYTYRYISEQEMFRFLQPILADEMITTYPVDNQVTWDGNRCTVTVTWKLVASDNPADFELVVMTASAADKGDKALAKANTSAVRFLFWKLWRFPQADPDVEGQSVPYESKHDQELASHIAEVYKAAEAAHIPRGQIEARLSEYHTAQGGVTHALLASLLDEIKRLGATQTPPKAEAAPTPAPPVGGAENASQAPQDPALAAAAALMQQQGTPETDPGQLQRIVTLAGELAQLDPERGTDPIVRLANINEASKASHAGRTVDQLSQQEAAAVIERVELAVAAAREKAGA